VLIANIIWIKGTLSSTYGHSNSTTDKENWLVDYSIENQDIEEALHGISLDLRDLEGELFNIKIRHEINMAPMKNYIEEWFKKAINKLTTEGQ
jgi:hypothetical protein